MSTDDLTVTYLTVGAKRQAEAAVERMAAQRVETFRLRQILNLDMDYNASTHVEDTIHLGEETYIVRVGGGKPGSMLARAPYTVVHDGQATNRYHATLDEALLRVVELRNGGGQNSRGYLFAARALGVPTTEG